MADNMFDEQGDKGRKKRRRTDCDDTKTTNVVVPSSSIHSLPGELVVGILARIAAHSLFDLLNARLSCRRWNELGDNDFVYKHALLDKLPILQWKSKTTGERERCLFLQKCVDAGNLEALYRRGLVDYLDSGGTEYDAVGYLKKAANAGHIASQYAVGIISIFLGRESDRIRMLYEMMYDESMKEEIRAARLKQRHIFNMIRPQPRHYSQKPICCTKSYGCTRENNSIWGPIHCDTQDPNMGCKICEFRLKFLFEKF